MAERDAMDEVKCTAIVGDDGDRPNILFTPPCACPRCVPEPVTQRRPERNWIRLPGDPSRHRVEVVTLGERGRLVLG